MKKFRTPIACLGAMAIASLLGTAVAQDAHTNGQNYHIFPTISQHHAAPPPADPGPLLYNGGPVMQNGVVPYIIYWAPAKLQNGTATSIPTQYRNIEFNAMSDYIGHGLYNNSTQYFETSGSTNLYIQNKGTPAIVTADADAYPASGCSDAATPGNCITDAQLQAEIAKVMAAKGWVGGLNHIFMVFTSSGEGSCFDSSGSSCAYVQYCAYHSFFVNGSTPVIYANMPFADPSVCQAPGTPSPNGNVDADEVASTASHELTEAITDPELNAWFTAQGNEIGDLCAYNYGTLTWDGAKANEMWNGHFYTLQMEYDNHTLGCVQVGP
jgi:Phosphate-induced protein 1 conserved region